MPKITFMNELVTVEVPAGKNLLAAAEEAGVEVFRNMWPQLHCRGAQPHYWLPLLGHCGRCQVWVNPLAEGALNARTSSEKKLPAGTVRLACEVIVSGDCEVRTRVGGPARKPSASWEADPRPWKWKERWGEKPAEKPAGDKPAVDKPAAKAVVKPAVAPVAADADKPVAKPAIVEPAAPVVAAPAVAAPVTAPAAAAPAPVVADSDKPAI